MAEETEMTQDLLKRFESAQANALIESLLQECRTEMARLEGEASHSGAMSCSSGQAASRLDNLER